MLIWDRFKKKKSYHGQSLRRIEITKKLKFLGCIIGKEGKENLTLRGCIEGKRSKEDLSNLLKKFE